MSEADSQRVETVAAAETIRAIVDNLGRVVHAPDDRQKLRDHRQQQPDLVQLAQD